MDLKLIYSSDKKEVYKNRLKHEITKYNPSLLEQHCWDRPFITSISAFKNDYVGPRSPIIFTLLPDLLMLELKLYWAKILSDERNNSKAHTDIRRIPMRWLHQNWKEISLHFGVETISEIPHPEFPKDGFITSKTRPSPKKHNQDLINLFALCEENLDRPTQKTPYVKAEKLIEKEYTSSRITIIGDFHKNIIINSEQLKPIEERYIIFLNDLYDEKDYRFKDIQRNNDAYLNFYLFPVWMRKAIKTHLLEKIRFYELGPKTLHNYFGRIRYFRDFMYEKFKSPSPSVLTRTLIEDDFIAWGNENKRSGKNWFTDTVAMLETAARIFPEEWPSLTITPRIIKKIKNSHYSNGLGRLGYCKESVGRAYSQRVIDDLKKALDLEKGPLPAKEIFSLILATGARAEDGHAFLYDCLIEDPHDERFMLLHFWQNKVRKWNIKPLLKADQSHAFIIKLIKNQKIAILHKYKQPTKYLFPIFMGTKESFTAPSSTLSEIKKVCVKHQVLDEKGNVLAFSWHPLRHTKGSSMASEGHDILTIMMELGHTSPDMATVYVNNILELKKQALLDKGSGRFFTIKGEVDEKVATLLVKKEELLATRVCGGACLMPAQIAEWCEHAHSCYTCSYFRADENDLTYFKTEKTLIEQCIENQQEEVQELKGAGRNRMSEITQKRLQRNKDVYYSLVNIITAIEYSGAFKGTKQNIKQLHLEFTDE